MDAFTSWEEKEERGGGGRRRRREEEEGGEGGRRRREEKEEGGEGEEEKEGGERGAKRIQNEAQHSLTCSSDVTFSAVANFSLLSVCLSFSLSSSSFTLCSSNWT